MGIDVYLHWKEQTEAERQAQYTGFSIAHGHVGYLREAYHGSPYATQVLIPEGWQDDEQRKEQRDGYLGVPIKAAVLRERLPAVLAAARKRSKAVYHEALPNDSPILKSYRDFVALAEKLEAEGKQVHVYVSY